jgi:hypothetical protein
MILSYKALKLEEKKENPFLQCGRILLKSGGFFSVGGFLMSLTLSISKFKLILNIDTQIGIVIVITGVIQIIFGIIFIFLGLSGIRKAWSDKVFYYLQGMENQTDDPPLSALSKMATWYSLNIVRLKIKSDAPNSLFDDLQHHQRIITEKVNQYNSKEIFFAGIARVPYLFFIGYAFRNAHSSTVTLIEHIHLTDKWITLKSIDDTYIDTVIEAHITTNKNKIVPGIAIAIEFTCEIPKDDIPLNLQENFVKIKLTANYAHNQINSKMTVERIVENIVNQLVILNKNCTRLHLFISAQSTVVFSLGRRFQNGMIGNISVYQYDPIKKSYTWAISLTDNVLELNKLD